jgi:hypothetical protein
MSGEISCSWCIKEPLMVTKKPLMVTKKPLMVAKHRCLTTQWNKKASLGFPARLLTNPE